jgi:uroporphyrinogen III methyltransferase/synthase
LKAGENPKPLRGKTIAVTRARAQAAAFAGFLRAAGARVVIAPAIAFAPPRSRARLDRALRDLPGYDLVLFTSANGVAFFLESPKRRRAAARALAQVRVVAIGPATAEALRRRGVRVDATPKEFRAEGLVALLGRTRVRGCRVLLPRAAEGREVLTRVLRRRGARLDVVPVYRTVPDRKGLGALRRALRSGRLDCVTFASGATVEQVIRGLAVPDRRLLRRVPASVIGPITAAAARRRGFRVLTAPRRATVEDWARALVRSLADPVVE